MFNHQSRAEKSTKYQLPTGVVCLHGNLNRSPWNILVERDSDGENYAQALQRAVTDSRVLTRTKINLRPVNFQFINNNDVVVDAETGAFSAEDKAKFEQATLVFFYEVGSELLETLNAANVAYGKTGLTVYVMEYNVKQGVARANAVEHNLAVLTAKPEKLPSLQMLAEPDSISFSFLVLESLTKLGASQKAEAEKSAENTTTPKMI